MILHCYTSTYNDLYMLKYYVRHWSQYAAKIFVYDDDSTDGTREFLESHSPLVQIMSTGFSGIDELKLQEMRIREYKIHSRGVADWCVIGDSDEFHYHPTMIEKLRVLKECGYAAVVSHGYQMFSDTRPNGEGQMMEYCKNGILDGMYDRVIFRPEIDIVIGIGHHGFTIDETNFREFQTAGQNVHTSPEGQRIKYPVMETDEDFKMLHYKYLGLDHITERHDRIWSRSSQLNKDRGWGIHTSPDWHAYYSLDWFKQKIGDAKPCLD